MIKADDLLNRIDIKIVEAEAAEPRRGYLGASSLGRTCDRQVWLDFHWASREIFDGRKLRLFNRGHEEEDRVYRWLKPIAEQLMPTNPKTGKQWKATAHNDILSGSCDGAVKIDGVWYLLEVKTHNKESYSKLIKLKSIKAAKPVYYTQVQLYMGLMKLKQCIHINVCKDDDSMYIEIIELDADYFQFELDRGLDIILDEDGTKSIRCSESSMWWECNMCSKRPVCKDGKEPDRNCRTCKYGQPALGTTWFCSKFEDALPIDQQETRAIVCDGYDMHDIFKPEEKVTINLGGK